MADLTTDLQQFELWPIKAKGEVTRLNPLGDPSIEQYYHTAMEQGRFLERNLGDAQHWLLQKKKDLLEKISMYSQMNTLAIDGKLPDFPRSLKYTYDSIQIIKAIRQFQSEIVDLIAAIQGNIATLQAIEASMLNMVQSSLNSLALTLSQICNWGLPNLPSIPNLFPDGLWHWNGFNFFPLNSFAKLAPPASFDPNFTFAQCSVRLPNLDNLNNQPLSVSTYSGLNYGASASVFNPPLGGTQVPTGTDLSDPAYTSLMQSTVNPVYLGPLQEDFGLAQPFNTSTSVLGSLPSPSTIVSNYQMPSDVYRDNIVSIIPSLRDQVIQSTDSDFNNPNLVIRNPNLQKNLAYSINLESIVNSNYDSNITACWLFYMQSCRNGRGGLWIPEFQVYFNLYLQPSLTYLSTTEVPWNCVLPSSTLNDGPKAIPLIPLISSNSHILWVLSYLESSLLGYPRSTQWDTSSTPEFLNSPTMGDLDYRSTVITSNTSSVALGLGSASYPVTTSYPTSISETLLAVISKAAKDIDNNVDYTSSRTQFKFVYDSFAVATEVDRFSQFWREFSSNLQSFLLQDAYLVGFAVSYPELLDSAINPLGDLALYIGLRTDAVTRDRQWSPGTPVLSLPKSISVVSPSSTIAPSGWSGDNFDPSLFLNRPDIQALSIPVQTAMLRTNLSYSSIQQYSSSVLSNVQSAIANQKTLIQGFSTAGWESVSSSNTPIGAGTNVQFLFDRTDYDDTGNVQGSGVWIVQESLYYAIVIEIYWGEGDAGSRNVNLLVNGDSIAYSSSQSEGPVTLQLALMQTFNQNDKITVQVSHGLSTIQNVISGSYFSSSAVNIDPPSSLPSDNLNGVPVSSSFISGTSLSEYIAVSLSSDGKVYPLDTSSDVTISGFTTPPLLTGVTVSSSYIGTPAMLAYSYGSVYTYSSGGLISGNLIYVSKGGLLTQSYSQAIQGSKWLVVMGYASSESEYVYSPHLPVLISNIQEIP